MMQFADRAFGFVDGMMQNINDLTKQSVSSYCRLDTTDEMHDIIADDGSRVTIIEHLGCFGLIGTHDILQMVNYLNTSLSSRFIEGGHCIQVIKTYDPEQAKKEIKEKFEPSRITLKNFGMDADFIYDEWEHSISQYCSAEHVLIVAWTRPECLSRPELKVARRNMRNSYLHDPHDGSIQNVGKVMVELRERHSGFVSLIESSCKDAGMITKRLNCHEALWWVRHEIDPAFTSRHWKACIPGDNFPMKLSDQPWTEDDISEFFYPSFKKQLFPREAKKIDRTTLRIGDHLHAPIALELAPQTPQPFNMLFKRLINKKMPFRASFLLQGGAKPAELALKKFFANLLSFTSSKNKMFAKAVSQLNARAESDITSVKFSACFDTWVFDDESPKAIRLLKKRRSELVSAIQAWGTCDCAEISGDPLLGVMGTIPAIMPTNPAPKTMPPLQDALYMLPINRMATIWDQGSLVFRTPDGKIMPQELGSSLQTSWIEVGIGPMGTSKSVHLNTLNWGYITKAGLTDLPYLTILDVGRSATGLIKMTKAMLPPDQQHVAESFVLRLDPDHSINPFDLPLGCQKPIDRHKIFLTNLLCLFATPLDAKAPPDGIVGIARKAIDAAYDKYSDEISPKKYVHGIDTKIDDLVEGLNIPIDKATTWRDISRFLFDRQMYKEASHAQRYAVPVLTEVAAMVKEQRVAGMYEEDKVAGGSTVPHYFWRSLIEAITAYPILKNPTQFEISEETKILSIDLEEVAPKGAGAAGDRQTAIMLMLARHVGASRFFMKPEDAVYVPEHYRAYHKKRLEALAKLPKRLCYDEFHRYIGEDSIVQQLTKDLKTAGRESRKWGLQIGLYSQEFEDIPDTILELAQTIYILGSGTNENVDFVVKKFGLDDTARRAITNLRKPKRQGATFFAIFRTEDGMACQLLTNTLGMRALWAFSSTKEDRNVRDPLYDKIGIKKTLTLLAKKYPGGVKGIVESRQKMITEKSALEIAEDVETELINEILQLAA